MGKKILITATELHLIQFWTEHIKGLIENSNTVDIVCSNIGGRLEELKERLRECGNPRLNVVSLQRSPSSPKNLLGYFQLRKYFKENDYDVVITNEPVMGVMTRLAARTMRKRGAKVIYFAHGFHFWKGAPFLNWALFYPIEKIGSHFADVIVTMNSEDYALAKKHFNCAEIKYTYGIGVDLSEFVFDEKTRKEKRKSLNINDDEFVFFSAAELSARKNLVLALHIVKRMHDKGFKVRYFVRGTGPLEDKLKEYITENKLENIVSLMGYGKDIKEMCLAADAFLFTSKQEGLPAAVMEAMSCNLPCLASDIRGVNDLIQNGRGGFVCRLNDVDGFCEKAQILIENNNEDFRGRLTQSNKEVLLPYSRENVFSFINGLIE